jgi:hypothetical protein
MFLTTLNQAQAGFQAAMEWIRTVHMRNEAKNTLPETLEFNAKTRDQMQADVARGATVIKARVAELGKVQVALQVTKENVQIATAG